MIRKIKSLLCLLVQCNISFKHRRSALEIFTQGEMQYARRLQHLWHAMQNTSPLDSAALFAHFPIKPGFNNVHNGRCVLSSRLQYTVHYTLPAVTGRCDLQFVCAVFCLFALFKTGALQPCHDRDKNNNEDADVLLWVRSAKTDWGPQLTLTKSLKSLQSNIQTYCSLLALYLDKQRNTHAPQLLTDIVVGYFNEDEDDGDNDNDNLT